MPHSAPDLWLLFATGLLLVGLAWMFRASPKLPRARREPPQS